jgi:MATE family multidrug resistance protein
VSQNSQTTTAGEAAGRGPTLELLILSLPIIAMMVSRMAMGFIDFVMVSRLGTDAQAAISPASILVFVFGVLGLGIAHAIQTFVSQADGRGDAGQAGGYAWQSFYIAAAFLVVSVPLVGYVDVWFGWLARRAGHTPTVMKLEIDYLRIALWSIAPSIICIGLNGFFMGVQKPWIAFAAVTASLAANAFGNWVLIFGNLGFPALGVAGAAYATVFAWCVRAAVLALAALHPHYDRHYNTRRATALDWEKMRGLIRIGAPTSLGWLVDIGSWTVFMMLIMPIFGTNAMAAANIGMQYMHLSFMPAMGIGIALCSQVGFAIGAGRPERALQRTRIAFMLTGSYMGAVGLVFLLAGRWLVSGFNTEPAVLAAGATVLTWAAVFQVFDAMAITHMNALRGAGDTRWPAVLMFVCCWSIFIAGGYYVAKAFPALGVAGPWMMCTMYIIVVGLSLMWRWYGQRWRNIAIFSDQPPQQAVETPDEAPIGTATAGFDSATGEESDRSRAPAVVTK